MTSQPLLTAGVTTASAKRYRLPGIEREGIAQLSLLETALWPLEGGKFPGDALYPVCADGGCAPCGDEDPYSFRLTVVMPGWAAPFDTNLDLRDFADRTIRQEIPAHLLGKICWVGNEGFAENVCAPVVSALATLLEKKGVTASEERPTKDDACTCAATLYAAFSAVFKTWYDDKTLLYVQADALTAALIAEFADKIKPGDLSCVVKLDGALWAEVQATLVNYFHYIALYGWQFERFEDAWCQWLDSNAAFDWTEERLQAARSGNANDTGVPQRRQFGQHRGPAIEQSGKHVNAAIAGKAQHRCQRPE